MKESDPKILFDYLEKEYDSWYSTKDKNKSDFIEDRVIEYIHNMDDSIYAEVSEVSERSASGLCSFPPIF